jgi:hypothetical protein
MSLMSQSALKLVKEVFDIIPFSFYLHAVIPSRNSLISELQLEHSEAVSFEIVRRRTDCQEKPSNPFACSFCSLELLTVRSELNSELSKERVKHQEACAVVRKLCQELSSMRIQTSLCRCQRPTPSSLPRGIGMLSLSVGGSG